MWVVIHYELTRGWNIMLLCCPLLWDSRKWPLWPWRSSVALCVQVIAGTYKAFNNSFLLFISIWTNKINLINKWTQKALVKTLNLDFLFYLPFIRLSIKSQRNSRSNISCIDFLLYFFCLFSSSLWGRIRIRISNSNPTPKNSSCPITQLAPCDLVCYFKIGAQTL